MRYVGIYRTSDTKAADQGYIFDISMTQHPWRDEEYEWPLVAVIQMPPNASLTTDYHRPDVVDHIQANSRSYSPVEVLNGQLEPVIIWSKANA